MLQAAPTISPDGIGPIDAMNKKATEPQDVFGDRAHRHLPRIEFPELAAHGHEYDGGGSRNCGVAKTY